MANNKDIKIGNWIVLIVALIFIGIGVYVATIPGTSINVAVTNSKPWQWIVSAISFLAAVVDTYYLSMKWKKHGEGASLGKSASIIIFLAISFVVWYL